MKFWLNNEKRFSSFVFLLAMIGSLSIASLPNAMAENSPLITFSPSTPDVGGSVLVTLTGDPTVGPTATAPHTDVRVGFANPGFFIFDPGVSGPDGDGDGDADNCGLSTDIPPTVDED